jgi:biotin carboxyl carrier protein
MSRSFKISNEHGAVAIQSETAAFVPYDSFVWTIDTEKGARFTIDDNGYLKHNDLFVIVNSTSDNEDLYRFYLTKFDTLLSRSVVGRRVKAEIVDGSRIFRTVPGKFDARNEDALGRYFALVNRSYPDNEIIKPEKFFRKIIVDGKQTQGTSTQFQQVGIPYNLRWPFIEPPQDKTSAITRILAESQAVQFGENPKSGYRKRLALFEQLLGRTDLDDGQRERYTGRVDTLKKALQILKAKQPQKAEQQAAKPQQATEQQQEQQVKQQQQTKQQQAASQSHQYLDRVIGLLEDSTGKKFEIKVRLLSLYQTILDTKKQNLGQLKTKIQQIKSAFVGSVGRFYVVDGRGGGLRYESPDRIYYTTDKNSFTPFRFDADLNLLVGTPVVSNPDTRTRAIVHASGKVDLINRNDYYLLNTGKYRDGGSINFEKRKQSSWTLQPVGDQDPMTKEQQRAVQQKIHAARQALHKRLESKALREAIASEKSTPEFRQELKKKLAELLAKRGKGGFGGSTAAPKKKQQGWSAPCTPEQYYGLYYKAVQG